MCAAILRKRSKSLGSYFQVFSVSLLILKRYVLSFQLPCTMIIVSLLLPRLKNDGHKISHPLLFAAFFVS